VIVHVVLASFLSAALVTLAACASGDRSGPDAGDGAEDEASADPADVITADGDVPEDPAPPDGEVEGDGVCTPGESLCIDAATRSLCRADGSGYDSERCPDGYACVEGVCMGSADITCAEAEAMRYSIGCVYFAVDTNPLHSTAPGNFAVALSNINRDTEASVSIEYKSGSSWYDAAGGPVTLMPLQLETVSLPHRFAVGSSVNRGGAYRITSDSPIIVYQFNPLDGSSSYFSDASLLLPTSSLDTHYVVPAWPMGPADDDKPFGTPAHIQIAAARSGDTQVTVTTPILTAAGTEVAAVIPNTPTTFTLGEGDVLQLDVATFMDSFTGTTVTASGPVALFSSNDCVNVPADLAACCCEHLEEQVFGLQTWGERYVASRVPQRGSEAALWQILAAEDGTNVSFDAGAGVTGLPGTLTLDAGQVSEFMASGGGAQPGDFMVTADKPVLVTQFMVGAYLVAEGSNNGDPSMVQAVPVDQYLDRTVVLVPETWENDSFIITRPSDAEVTIDGFAVEPSVLWSAVGASGYEVARVPASDGVHVIEGSRPLGVLVVGYDAYDSYAYPGGLNQQLINLQ